MVWEDYFSNVISTISIHQKYNEAQIIIKVDLTKKKPGVLKENISSKDGSNIISLKSYCST